MQWGNASPGKKRLSCVLGAQRRAVQVRSSSACAVGQCVTWEEALELLDGLPGAAVALGLPPVRLGLAQLPVHALQLLGEEVPLRPVVHHAGISSCIPEIGEELYGVFV